MFENKKFQIRISSELLGNIRENNKNMSLFIREAIREKVASGKGIDPSVSFIEIRARTPYTYFAELIRIIDGDTLHIDFDLGFFANLKVRVRLSGIDCPPIDTEEGMRAAAFIEKELTGVRLLVLYHSFIIKPMYILPNYHCKEKIFIHR